MTKRAPSILHSWLVNEKPRHFVLGHVMGPSAELGWATDEELAEKRVGRWECDLVHNDSLTWTNEVYDLFGFRRDTQVARSDAVGRYCDQSRDILERIRSYAIGHCRSFVLDAEISPSIGTRQWIRIVAAPVLSDHRVVRLQGLKLPL